MEVQVQELLETIKKDGVDSAEKMAAGIISEAESTAKSIIASAEKKAGELKDAAQRDASRFENSATAAISQAGRDLLISIQQGLQSSFDSIIQKTVGESFSGDALADCIVSVVKAFNIQGNVELPPATLKELEASLKAKLGSEIKSGLEIRVNNLLSGGFVLREKAGKAYFDFSDESIAEVIRAALNRNIAELISIK